MHEAIQILHRKNIFEQIWVLEFQPFPIKEQQFEETSY